MIEIGLPRGWTRAPLAALCSPVPSIEPAKQAPDDVFVYIDISAIDRSSRQIVEPKRLRGEDAPSRARQLVTAGDILYSTVRPNLRTFAVVPPELSGGVASTGFCVLRANEAVRPGYLAWLLWDPLLQDRISAKARGVSYPAVREDDILEEMVVLPPPLEQDRILELLAEERARYEAATTAIGEGERLIPLLRMSALEELSKPKWPLRRIDAIGEVFVGATPPRKQPELWDGDVPWVSSSEVAFCRITRTNEQITRAGVGNWERRVHPAGTVLLAMYGEGKTRGQAAILDIEAATNQAVAAVRVDEEEMRPSFLYLCLMRQYNAVRSLGRGGQQLNLNKELVKSIEVPCPPVDVQDEVVSMVQAQLRTCEEQESALAVARSLARGTWVALLRDALTGELTTRIPGAQTADQVVAEASAASRSRTRAGRRPRVAAVA